MRLIRALSSLVITILMIGTLSVVGLIILYRLPGPAVQETVVIIPKGSSTKDIAARLFQHGLLSHTLPFLVVTRLTASASQLKAGEYAFPAKITMRSIVAMMQEGRVVVRKFTVPEGLTSAQIVALLKNESALTGEINNTPPEGSLLPETYYFSYGDDRNELLSRMSANMKNTITGIWYGTGVWYGKRPNTNIPLKTPEEMVTLASIVEKETAVPEERARVAGVYLNRLRLGMLLQSDPTTIYAVTQGHLPLERSLTYKDLRDPSPYNTYVSRGLPPGPIANPGRASLEAVINPEHHEFLYFVADGTGRHVFARTFAEHQQNVLKWRQLSRQHPVTETPSSEEVPAPPLPSAVPGGPPSRP